MSTQTRPSIDHGILSPSGRMSKRARKAALQRMDAVLFPPGYWNRPEPSEAEKKRARAQQLLRHAARLRDLAAGGMKPRAYPKAAAKAEAEAVALLAAIDG
jgi:hypothetical protein